MASKTRGKNKKKTQQHQLRIDAMAAEIEKRALSDFSEKAYLDYAMYVILDRALPHVGDGLKPVQRRIVYAMSELGLSAAAKFKKSARTVGDVLGKYHPHGDSAAYEAMVLMAQDFSYRYPLVDGQGNWGTQDDPKSFAAMRYTESRLTRYAQALLAELGQGTVEWGLNFDGTLREPKLLPSRLPNMLLNGASGIAVGMATDIPPHNLREVVAATIHRLRNPKCSLDELLFHLPGPDFPTAGELITPAAELREIYQSGSGQVRQRAAWEREGDDIVVTDLPYQVSGSKVLAQIASQMQAKKLPMVDDLRDESDHENPTRLVISPRSNRVDVDGLMAHLFATTDLERSYRVQLNAIGLDGKPHLYTLPQLLDEWLLFRLATVRRRLEFRLDKVLARLHILDGLLIAYLDLDEVIRIIRFEEEPKAKLMERFGLSDAQAEAILELKLRYLSRLEEMKIRGEQDELRAERESLETTLGSEARLKTLVRKELEADAAEFGDERRCKLVADAPAAQAMSESDLIPTEPVSVILSEKGWVRTAKGHDIDAAGLSYKAGDRFLAVAHGKNVDQAVFLDSTGRSYSLAARSFPSARGQGEPLSSSLNPAPGAPFLTVLMASDDALYLIASTAGYGFLAPLGELHSRNKAGKVVLTLPGEAEPMLPRPAHDVEQDQLAAISSDGYLLLFALSELPQMAKGKGVKLLNLPKAKKGQPALTVIDATVVPTGSTLRVHAGQRYMNLKPADQEHFQGSRAQRGKALPRGFRNATALEVV